MKDTTPQATLTTDATTTKLPGRSIAFASGKGGVGKTTLAANVAVLAAEYERNVVLVDLDLGLANLDVVFRLEPGPTLRDVLSGTSIDACVQDGPGNIRILPASSGYRDMAQLATHDVHKLLGELARLSNPPDLTIFDAAAGISDSVVETLLGVDEIVLVTTPDPSAVTDAYALLKILVGHGRRHGIYLTVNFAESMDDAFHTAGKIARAAESFLGIDLRDFGWVGRDRAVSRAGVAQKILVHSDPAASASRNIRFVASRILSGSTAESRGPAS